MGKDGCARLKANPLAVHTFWRLAVSKNEEPCLFLAALIAMKYPAFELPATSHMCGVSCLLATLAALCYSGRRIVRRGDHQGLE